MTNEEIDSLKVGTEIIIDYHNNPGPYPKHGLTARAVFRGITRRGNWKLKIDGHLQRMVVDNRNFLLNRCTISEKENEAK